MVNSRLDIAILNTFQVDHRRGNVVVAHPLLQGARDHVPVLTCTSLPGAPEDHQARYIEAAVQKVLITSIYLSNGNPQPGAKFNYKLAWFERLIALVAELLASGAPVVLAGDYNVLPIPQDIYPTRSALYALVNL